jgi:hypothetical protein
MMTNENAQAMENMDGNARRSALPSKELRTKKDPFEAAAPLVGEAANADDAVALAKAQEKAAEEWQSAHEADAPRRAEVLRMKGCLDGQCCYMVPGKMQAGPSVYKD